MITKYKIFESINEESPKVGDYVIIGNPEMKPNNRVPEIEQINICCKSIIGQIIGEQQKYNNFAVAFEEYDIPYSLRIHFSEHEFFEGEKKVRWVKNYEITNWAKTKEELEPVITAIKYNL